MCRAGLAQEGYGVLKELEELKKVKRKMKKRHRVLKLLNSKGKIDIGAGIVINTAGSIKKVYGLLKQLLPVNFHMGF